MKTIASTTLLPSAEFEVVDILVANGMRPTMLYRTHLENPVSRCHEMVLEQLLDDEEKGVIP